MNVQLIDHMGSDLSVVNAARVSFDKESSFSGKIDHNTGKSTIRDKDKKLISYLAKHDHWSPFGHASMQFRIKAPIFVARQLVKHQVGLVWNEVSRRYVDNEPEFYIPKNWRLKAEDKKQGSSDEYIEYSISSTMEYVKETYNNLLKSNVAPEMARMVLPQNLYTEWYWSGTLGAFLEMLKLRLKCDTQQETRQIAIMIAKIVKQHWPVSYSTYL